MHFLTESCWEFFLPALCNASPFSGKSNKKQASIWIPYPTPTLSSAGRLLQALNCSTEMSPDPAVSGKCPGETYGKHVPWLGAGVIIFLITATTVLYVVFFFPEMSLDSIWTQVLLLLAPLLLTLETLPHKGSPSLKRQKRRRWTCWEIAPCRKRNCFSLSVPHLSFSLKKK